jgi:hypothetical protein
MNEVLLGGSTRLEILGHALKRAAWSVAGQFALHGLCPWNIDERWVRLIRREMALPDLAPSLEGLKVCHLSDLHCSPLMREQHLRQVVEMVNRLEPDYAVITGDFITATSRHYGRRIGGLLRHLSPRIETLAVLGNHDYGVFVPNQREVRGLSTYLTDQLTAGGVRVLTNEVVTCRRGGQAVHFAGIGDLWSPDYHPTDAFEGLDPREPIIALVHNPDAAIQLASLGARYVLAGHTHGRGTRNTRMHNALFPAAFLGFIAGEYDLGEGRRLYVNRGIGPSRRVCANSRPEVTLFTLRRALPQVRPSLPASRPIEINSDVAASTLRGMCCPLPQDEPAVATS